MNRLFQIALGFVVLLGAGAISAQQFTGCLTASKGFLYHVQEADTPLQPCRALDLQVSWSIEGPPGPAGGAQPFKFVGVTSTEFQGSPGVGDRNRACANEVDAASRMCTTVEYMNTVNPPAISGNAWIRPVIVAASVDDTGSPINVDASGVYGVFLSCFGWTDNTSTRSGLAVTTSGSFMRADCNGSFPTACCAPVQ